MPSASVNPFRSPNFRVPCHLIQTYTKHSVGTKITINDAAIDASHRTRATSVSVQRILAATVNNVNKTVIAAIPLGNVSATHARHTFPVITVKSARSIHHEPTIRSKRVTHTTVSHAIPAESR